jgi:MFS family permease
MKHDLADAKSAAYAAILLLGIVSLLGDVVYEGSRGLVPAYLGFLGASAFIVTFVGGLGDFLGNALRLLSGFLADTTRAYWLFILLGYGLIASIPLLGFASGWEIAVILVLLERLGKAFRSPSRDTLLSVVSRDVGAGKAFGIHELLDQVGAVLGPLIMAALMFFSSNNYHWAFGFLFLPFLMLLVALVYTYKRMVSVKIAESKITEVKSKSLGKPFYIYTFAVILNTIGLIPVMLISYKAYTILPEQQQWMVPLIYLLIQGVDASIALISGYAYDKFGIKFLTLAFTLSIIPPLLIMVDTDLTKLIIASIFFGLVLGMQESIYRAAVSEFAPVSLRGTAYGIFNAAYGVSLAVNGAVYGLLAELKPPFITVIFYVFTLQIAAIALLLNVHSRSNNSD